METLREKQKAEAVAQMKIIGIYPETVRQFEEEGLVSESLPPYGACYWVKEAQTERIREFEEHNNCLVYHVIRGKYLLGGQDVMEMESYLYVSKYEEDWKYDREDIEHGQISAYIYNVTDPMLSEGGAIGIKLGPAGGLLRTW